MSDNLDDKLKCDNNNVLLQEFCRLSQELSNQHYSTVGPEKIAKINELEKAREKIRQQIIASDESSDNSVVYAAMAKFKKRNG